MILTPVSRQSQSDLLDLGSHDWDRDLDVQPCVLRVCKQWLRIETPIFYETLIIDSSDELNAYAKLFKTNPAIAKFVKNLRITEFGNKLPTVLALTSNVRNLCIAPYVHHTQSIAGLMKAVNNVDKVALSPKSLWIMKQHKGRYSKKCRTAVICMILLACEWSSLVSVLAHSPPAVKLNSVSTAGAYRG